MTKCCVCERAAPDYGTRGEDRSLWVHFVGLTSENETLWCCPTCRPLYLVALDWALERGGEPPLAWSLACAFAFHLGQYEDAARAEQWDRVDHLQPAATAQTMLRQWRGPDFIDPTTKGRYGWGRWSTPRRESQRLHQPWDPLYRTDRAEMGRHRDMVDAAAFSFAALHETGTPRDDDD